MSSEEPTSVASRFGLTRDNFILDPIEDHACFARNDIPTGEIAASLDIDVVTGLAPKRLVWGPYGAGKTHTLMRTMEELGKLARVHPVRIECPDLARKSRFHDLYREGIMRGLGQDFVLGLMEGVVEKVGFRRADELRTELKKWFNDEEMSKAAERLYDPNFERLKLWRWLSGVAMSRSDLDSLGQTQDLTQTEAARLADILILLGSLLRQLHDKTLVLILDEMERLLAIGPESITTFVSGFTRLVDQNQRSVCILIGSSAVLEGDMVELFRFNGPITSRLGADARIEIPSLQDADVDHFIKEVVRYLRDPAFDIDKAISESTSYADETLAADLYPFTAEAVDALKERLDSLTPRAITMQMTRALGRAHRKNQGIITSDCVG